MRLFITAVLLAFSSSANAQATAGDTPVKKPMVMPPAPARKHPMRQVAAPGAATASVKAADVPASAPVVTLQGVCKVRQAKSPCETVITREDLDLFVSLYAPGAPQTARGRLAVQYAKNLAFSVLAEQQGLEKNPDLAREIELQLKLVRMRLLANAFLENLQKEPPPAILEAEIEKYYNSHRDQYEQAQVRRVAVPFAVPTESGRHLDRAAVKSEMLCQEAVKAACCAKDEGGPFGVAL